MLTPKPLEKYRHFKGNCYQIICIAADSETGEDYVIYQGLYAPYKIYSRKLDMFMEAVDKEKYPNATQKYRFELLDEEGFVVDRNKLVNIAEDKTDDKTENNESNQSVNKEIVSEEKLEEKSSDNTNNKNTNSEESQSSIEEVESDFDRLARRDPKKAEEIKRRRAEAAKINPILAEFFNAQTDDDQLLVIMKHKDEITEDILLPMELSLDMAPGEGRLSDRILAVKNCLELRKRYERLNRN